MAFMLDYYYGSEGNQFAFYRVPKILFQDALYKLMQFGEHTTKHRLRSE